MKSPIALYLIAVLICLMLTSCVPLDPPAQEVPYQVARVVRSGEYRERVEVQDIPIYNCKNNAPIHYTVQRERSFENSVEFTLTTEASAEVKVMLANLRVAVGAEYGTTQSRTVTDSSGLEFTVEPNTYPVYYIAWRENWEEGHIVVNRNGVDETIEYSYLKNARPEIHDIKHIGCEPAQLALATAEASNNMSWTTLYQEGVAAVEKGDYALAVERLTDAVRLLPSRPAAFYYRGLAFSGLGNLQAAIDDQSQAIAIAPDFALAYVSRGDLLVQQGQFDRAISDYDKSITLDPANASGNLDNVYFGRGIAYLSQDNHDQVLIDLTRAMTLGGTKERRDQMVSKVMKYGRGLLDIPDHAKAEAVFRSVRLVDGANNNAVFWLAWTLYERGKLDDAMGHFDICLSRMTEDYAAGRCHAGKGFILYKKGAIAESLTELEMALSLYPDQADVTALRDKLKQ